MANLTAIPKSAVFPSYSLKPVPPLVPGCPDGYLLIALPIITYWIWGGLWYFIEHKDYFPQYRIHTSAEVLKRNRVPLPTILRNVATQQLITTVLGIYLTGEPDQYGSEEYDQARWVLRLRSVQAAVPKIFSLIGIDAVTLADNLGRSFPTAATFLRGGDYIAILNQQPGASATFNLASSTWEITAAWVLYWYLVPAFQFLVAIFIADSWQYFVHRTMHLNNWLYSSANFHSIHHSVYVPHAFGAFYASLLEAFVFDTIGTIASLSIAQLTTRQAMWFVTLSTMKSLDDHCGYKLPWDPFQWLGEQDTEYHDVHHQSWGIKTNFAQVYTTFWDHALGSIYKGDDLDVRYRQGREAAERWVERKRDEST